MQQEGAGVVEVPSGSFDGVTRFAKSVSGPMIKRRMGGEEKASDSECASVRVGKKSEGRKKDRAKVDRQEHKESRWADETADRSAGEW
jgi:hypothetical protein